MSCPAPTLPNHALGVGLRSRHMAEFMRHEPKVDFVEVHTENYFGGGIKLKNLKKVSDAYSLSFHGVGLSLGRSDALDQDHMTELKALIERFHPALVSEHLSFSAFSHRHVPDLLSMPLTEQSLEIVSTHVLEYQDLLGRKILIENPSNYMAFQDQTLSEPEFLLALSQATGCKLLIDINNIYVSAINLGLDPKAYLLALGQGEAIGQYHLAGHHTAPSDHGPVLIDTHGDVICDEVWALYDFALMRFGPRPTLIEWDTDVPELAVLLAEAEKARLRLQAKVFA